MVVGLLAIGLGLIGLGASAVWKNRALGRRFRRWNTGFLFNPEAAARQYREDRYGRVWLVIAVGVGWTVFGVVFVVAALSSPR